MQPSNLEVNDSERCGNDTTIRENANKFFAKRIFNLKKKLQVRMSSEMVVKLGKS